jgi:hypothetical protein
VTARSNSRDPIEPMDLADMRQNGVRSLEIVSPKFADKCAFELP